MKTPLPFLRKFTPLLNSIQSLPLREQGGQESSKKCLVIHWIPAFAGMVWLISGLDHSSTGLNLKV